MSSSTEPAWSGVFAALVCPMRPDETIDPDALSSYASWVASTPGITGLVVNGNAGEVSLLSKDERATVVKIARNAVGHQVKIVSGVMAGSTREAISDVNTIEASGADAALVFPIRDWMTNREPGSAEAFYEALSASCDLPLIAFQYPHNRGNAAFSVDTLVRIAELPTVVAVKEAVWEVARYQDEYYALKAATPSVAVLSANDEHLFATLAIGADGVLVGFAGLVPTMIARLFSELKAGKLDSARELDKRLWPLTQALYRRPPFALRHTRVKAALAAQGVIPSPAVRHPLLPLAEDEVEYVRAALDAAALQMQTPADRIS